MRHGRDAALWKLDCNNVDVDAILSISVTFTFVPIW